ncbi:hypothetical protein XELAEV_18010331mg [Xenopus laevis]|uniref:GIY-YIG domain-containing protein n=1 Tax=Xenopus laevis TaxID=8355 RepID=A0A974I1M6_XENLA|nr:hypothetical protein XELAEV_18010331mg [Xenopus laevis]
MANEPHPTVKLTMEVSESEINFLDINIKLNDNTSNAIPKGQYMRARKIASTDTAYNQAAKELTKRFLERGYPKGKLSQVEKAVQKITRQDLLTPKVNTRDTDRLTFISKYDRHSKNSENVVKKYWPLLQHDPKYGSIFTNPPRFAYKRGRSLRDILCPTADMENKMSVFKGIPKIGTFPSNRNHPTTGKEIRLRIFATCTTNFVVYALKCSCGKLYVGKTIRPVNIRIKQHKTTIRNFKADTYNDTPVSRNFAIAKHSVCQLRWKVLEVVPKSPKGGDCNNMLLQREARWIRRLDCIHPKRMNEQLNLSCFL